MYVQETYHHPSISTPHSHRIGGKHTYSACYALTLRFRVSSTIYIYYMYDCMQLHQGIVSSTRRLYVQVEMDTYIYIGNYVHMRFDKKKYNAYKQKVREKKRKRKRSRKIQEKLQAHASERLYAYGSIRVEREVTNFTEI